MRVILAALALMLLAAAPAVAAPPSSHVWRITKDHWSAADEAGFGRFVTALGDSGCTSSQSCLRSSANPWAANEDRAFLDIDVDCAKLPYLLRAYYAWKNGLPFTYADGVSGGRFSKTGNHVVSRQDITDHGGGIDGARAIRALPGWSAVPIVALTANAFAEDRHACLEAGMNDMLAKQIGRAHV